MCFLGCVSISKALNGNQTLKTLGFSQNRLIGDDGIAAIANVLGNCKLTMLDLKNCGITLVGARQFAASLPPIQRKIRVDLFGNAITVEGARLILQSAVKCKAPISVWVDQDYKSDEKVAEMLTVLKEKCEKLFTV